MPTPRGTSEAMRRIAAERARARRMRKTTAAHSPGARATAARIAADRARARRMRKTPKKT